MPISTKTRSTYMVVQMIRWLHVHYISLLGLFFKFIVHSLCISCTITSTLTSLASTLSFYDQEAMCTNPGDSAVCGAIWVIFYYSRTDYACTESFSYSATNSHFFPCWNLHYDSFCNSQRLSGGMQTQPVQRKRGVCHNGRPCRVCVSWHTHTLQMALVVRCRAL